MKIHDLSREVERGGKMYSCLKNIIEKSNVIKSNVNVGGELVSFWVEVNSEKEAVYFKKKFEKVLYNASIAETQGCFSLVEEVVGTVYRILVLFPPE